MTLPGRPALLAAAASVLLLAPVRAPAQELGTLAVESAVARFDTSARSGRVRDKLRMKARFPIVDRVASFDPAVDDLRVTIAGVDVIDVPAGTEVDGFRFSRRKRGAVRKWRYRQRGEEGTVGSRTLTASAFNGVMRLDVRHADIHAVREAGASDVSVSVALGNSTAQTTVPFVVTRSGTPTVWRFRAIPSSPQPPAPLAYTPVVAGLLADTPRPASQIARDELEIAALWFALGSPGPAPVVDFDTEMVVVVSALVAGPGPSPPILSVSAVRTAPGGIHADWNLFLCEEPNNCPGAPGVPCPTVTPFFVFRTRAVPGSVTLRQTPTLWVCP